VGKRTPREGRGSHCVGERNMEGTGTRAGEEEPCSLRISGRKKGGGIREIRRKEGGQSTLSRKGREKGAEVKGAFRGGAMWVEHQGGISVCLKKVNCIRGGDGDYDDLQSR